MALATCCAAEGKIEGLGYSAFRSAIMKPNPLARNNVTLAGNPNAERSIIFVNGIGSEQSVWNPVAAALSEQSRLVFFDHVGSVPANFEYFVGNQVRYMNAGGYAQDLLEICASLQLPGKTVLVGHSFGAIVSVLAAAKSPGQFEKLILIGASPRYLDDTDYCGGFKREDVEAIYQAMGGDYPSWTRVFAAAAAGEDRRDAARNLAESLARIPKEMMLTVLCSILQADHRQVLSKLRVPTLIIQSTHDYFVPLSVAEYLHAHIAGSELRMIDARGHLPHVTDAEKLIEVMRGFIGVC